MKKISELSNVEAKEHLLKESSYFKSDIPNYLTFEPILRDVDTILKDANYSEFKFSNPEDIPKVNYNFLSNKDGKLDWRPLELIHPAIYVSLVNAICDSENWGFIIQRLSEFENGVVDCCSYPVISLVDQNDVGAQIRSWWQSVEQKSLTYSLEFSHILHTDVINCYGSLYTHSISWALHGFDFSKQNKGNKSLLGNKIDSHIRAGRYGQTNGISQGSVLMDFIAEIVLGYVDKKINDELRAVSDFRILRYRDDYRIFANSDDQAEKVLQVISEKLRFVGMKLGVAKTQLNRNVVEGSIKPDKLAGIDSQDSRKEDAEPMQKRLLRLHSFGQRFPNSGALRRLISEFHADICQRNERPDDLEVQVAIATDIGFISPATFPGIAAILSHLISLAINEEKKKLWTKVRNKMARLPNNGYLEIWLQRVTWPEIVGLDFSSDEPICRIVKGENVNLWENSWVSCNALKEALDTSKIMDGSASSITEVIQPEEIELFRRNSLMY